MSSACEFVCSSTEPRPRFVPQVLSTKLRDRLLRGNDHGVPIVMAENSACAADPQYSRS